MTSPNFEKCGDIYRYTYGDTGIQIELDRLKENREGDLVAEIRIGRQKAPETNGKVPYALLHNARLNLLSTRGRAELAKELQIESGSEGWTDVIKYVSFLTVDKYRRGEPAVDLSTVEIPTGNQWLLKPFIEVGNPTLFFSPGGSGKSILGMAMALSVATGESLCGSPMRAPSPVLYLDWEADKESQAERLRALCIGHGLGAIPTKTFYHRWMYASIGESVIALRREITDLGIKLVVCDSLGAARGGAPESAEVTLAAFAAVRSLRCSFLGIDHLTKSKEADKNYAFGSVYSFNVSRLVWRADMSGVSKPCTTTVALVNTKRNNGPKISAQGYSIVFENDPVTDRAQVITVKRAELTTVEDLRDRVRQDDRVLVALRRGGLLLADIVSETGLPDDTVSPILSRLKSQGKVSNLGYGIWGLSQS